METREQLTDTIQTGDPVAYKSRKNGRWYVGIAQNIWITCHGREAVVITRNGRAIATPYKENVRKLTDEIHMLIKLENS